MKKLFCMVTIFVSVLAIGSGATTLAKSGLKPIIFGASLPLGDHTGVEAKRAAILASEEINKQGGIKLPDGMHPLKLEIMDTRDLEPGVPVSECLLVLERLILQKKVDFISNGPERSEAFLAAMDLVSRYKKIMLVSAAYAPRVKSKIAKDPTGKYKYIWDTRNDARTDIMHVIPLFKKFKSERGWNKVYVMVQDVAHTRAAGEAIKKVLGGMGWEVLGLERYPTGSTDFSLGLLEAKKKGADLLYLSFEMPQVSILMRQWHELKVPAFPMGLMTAASDPRFWEISKGGIEYAVCNMFMAGNGPSALPEATRFIKAFKDRWGIEPGTVTGVENYTNLWILKDAIERAGTIDSDAVCKALLTTDMKAPYGRVRFDPKTHQILITDDPNTGAVTDWIQWQKPGKRMCVWPPAGAMAEIQFPAWMK